MIAGKGGALYATRANMTFSGYNKLSNNWASLGGASYCTDSLVEFKHFQMFEQNFADQGGGGALALHDDSKLTLNEPLKADFIGSCTKEYGGAIFLEDSVTTISTCNDLQASSSQEACFFELNVTCSNFSGVRFNFIRNTAGSAGTIIYGGNLDSCRLNVHTPGQNNCSITYSTHEAIKVLQNISHIVRNSNDITFPLIHFKYAFAMKTMRRIQLRSDTTIRHQLQEL